MALLATMDDIRPNASAAAHDVSISVRLSHAIDDVQAPWMALQQGPLESPGQSFELVRTWVGAHGIVPDDQIYIVAERAGQPVALMPLWRRRQRGLRVLSWFAGSHVGCNGPLVDREALVAMGSVGRSGLWSAMLSVVEGVDLVQLKAVPELMVDGADLYAELGDSVLADTLYRASFSSWTDADTTQRSKSRRKHDRQQGDKLAAMGEVGFEEIKAGPDSLPLLDLMFQQRAARFQQMGVSDPFADPDVRRFYNGTLADTSGVDVRMHVLRLNGEIVAIRYNLAHGDRLYCLISSMSTEPSLQPGSPGKQCLLRVMQTVFDAGWRVFDMGAGFTDEKRHWCNVQVPVRDYFVPLNWRGEMASGLAQGWQKLRSRIKSDPKLMAMVKAVRTKFSRGPSSAASAD